MSDIAAILLPLNGTSNDAAALALGLHLARRFSAHLQALHAGSDSRDVAPLAGEGLSAGMVEEMLIVAERASRNRLTDATAMFRAGLAQAQDQARSADADGAGMITEVDRLPRSAPAARRATVSFRSAVGREHELVAYTARLSDLIIVPHPDSAEAISSSEALHAVLFDSGRPVIIAPKRAPATIGRRVCIAWNGTAESASAVLSILSWLHRADAVRVLHSASYQRQGPDAAELVSYLAGHGIDADSEAFTPVAGEVGAGLLAAADAFDADLLAMGAYSRSRLRQLILGGVTRHVIENAALPVLMAR